MGPRIRLERNVRNQEILKSVMTIGPHYTYNTHILKFRLICFTNVFTKVIVLRAIIWIYGSFPGLEKKTSHKLQCCCREIKEINTKTFLRSFNIHFNSFT